MNTPWVNPIAGGENRQVNTVKVKSTQAALALKKSLFGAIKAVFGNTWRERQATKRIADKSQ